MDEWMDPETICEHVVPLPLKQYDASGDLAVS